ncbi:MAG: aerotaxis receptor [Oceanicoccus sp.]|jgi:aerotaxis receptor
MKKNLPITNNERVVENNERIISSTNLKGQIEHVNQDFLKISGFTEEELIKSSHNIVRHPDMPEAAFKQAWDYLKRDKQWKGIVKNRCKNGDFYWVDAFITPVKNNGTVVGYESVRYKPKKESVARAEKVYKRLNKGKSAFPSKDKLRSLPLGQILSVLLGLTAVGITHFYTPLIALIPVAALAFVQGKALRNLKLVLKKARTVTQDPLASFIYTGRHDDVGEILMAFEHMQSQIVTLRERIQDTCGPIQKASNTSHSAAQSSLQKLTEQLDAATMFAAAFEEVTTQFDSISDSVNETAQQTEKAKNDTQTSERQMQKAKSTLEVMVDTINQASSDVQNLAEHSESIHSFLEVIQAIAEQTNLLALNAAIEAARAGEQGRGFAVVADEVRTLANRTSESTEEIRRIVDKLRHGAQDATEVMNKSREQATENVDQIQETYSILEDVRNSVELINQKMSTINQAVQEQRLGSEEISKHMEVISQSAQDNTESAKKSKVAANQVIKLVDEQFEIIERFR